MRGHFKRRTYRDKKTGAIRTATTWSVLYDLPTAPGEKRKQKIKSGFATKRDAVAWFTRKAEELRQGIAPADDRITVEQYLTNWLTTAEGTVSALALHAYKNHVEQHIIPALGAIRLVDLRATHVETAKARWSTSAPKGRKTGRLSDRTVRHIYSTLNTALNRAVRHRMIPVNPCEFVDAPRVERREMQALDAAAGARMIELLEGSHIGAAIVTALGTGLRRGELLALKWSDVDLDAGLLTVQRSLERATKATRFKDPKTKRSRRTVSIPRFVVDRLRRHRMEQAERFLSLGLGRPTADALVFERLGEPWVPNTFGTAFRRELKRLELPAIRLHDLRHSFASMALAAGVDLKTVSSALGHSTISTTADVYAHVTAAMKKDAAARLDAALAGAAKRASG